MTKVIEAIYSHGVLEPLEALELSENQRVELVVRPINGEAQAPSDAPQSDLFATKKEQEAALEELFAEIDRMDLHLRVRMPTRDEMHERG